MKVKDLIVRLQAMDPELPVYINEGLSGEDLQFDVQVMEADEYDGVEQRVVIW